MNRISLLQHLIVTLPFSIVLLGCSGDGLDLSRNFVGRELADYYQLKKSLPSGNLTLEEFSSYLQVDPIKKERCSLPSDSDFQVKSDKIGGFQFGFDIPLHSDEAQPKIIGSSVMNVEGSAINGPTTIERPNIVATEGSRALYLSKPFGIYAVETREGQGSVSCIFPLPGNPLNFYWIEDSIVILLNGRPTAQNMPYSMAPAFVNDFEQWSNQGNSAVLALRYKNGAFTIKGMKVFENAHIQDSRRFNSTLAIYQSMSHSRTKAQRLTFLNLANFEIEGAETFVDTDKNPDAPRQEDSWNSSTFNSFLSASEEYLIVSAVQTHWWKSGMQTNHYSVCAQYSEPHMETSCSTKFRKARNPDYQPPSSGQTTYHCGSDLMTCLRTVAPTASPWIWIADGQVCQDYEVRSCLRSEDRSYSYPIYSSSNTSELFVYRFQNGTFAKLDATSLELDGNEIKTASDGKVRGIVSAQSSLQFINQLLYVASSSHLTTLALRGNSLVKTSELSLIGAPSAVYMSPTRIFIDQSTRTRSSDSSVFSVYELSNPLAPIKMAENRLPGNINQLMPSGDQLIGLGSVTVGDLSDWRVAHPTLMKSSLFDFASGRELDNLLLGASNRFTNSIALTDDQAYLLTSQNLFLPYTTSGFFSSAVQNKVEIIGVGSQAFSGHQTLSFSDSIQRIASISGEFYLAFSDYSVSLISHSKEDSRNLQSQLIKEWRPPVEAYASNQGGWWVVRSETADKVKFVVSSREDLFSERFTDTIELPRPVVLNCQNYEVHFANHYILFVAENPEVVKTQLDCPLDRRLNLDNHELIVSGWQIGEAGKLTALDRKSAEEVLRYIQSAPECSSDGAAPSTEIYPLSLPEGVSC